MIAKQQPSAGQDAMTAQRADDSGDSPPNGIEITEEMVSAGEKFLRESGYLLYESEGGVTLLIRELLSRCLSQSNPCENRRSHAERG